MLKSDIVDKDLVKEVMAGKKLKDVIDELKKKDEKV